jgi:uncharacterized protein YneF (UPF0154 family)
MDLIVGLLVIFCSSLVLVPLLFFLTYYFLKRYTSQKQAKNNPFAREMLKSHYYEVNKKFPKKEALEDIYLLLNQKTVQKEKKDLKKDRIIKRKMIKSKKKLKKKNRK